MEKKNILANGFIIACIIMAGIFSYVLAHEATHLALSDEAQGICLGRCPYFSPEIEPSKGFAFATAPGVHNDLSIGEFWPSLVGLIVLIFVICTGIYSLETKEVKKNG